MAVSFNLGTLDVDDQATEGARKTYAQLRADINALLRDTGKKQNPPEYEAEMNRIIGIWTTAEGTYTPEVKAAVHNEARAAIPRGIAQMQKVYRDVQAKAGNETRTDQQIKDDRHFNEYVSQITSKTVNTDSEGDVDLEGTKGKIPWLPVGIGAGIIGLALMLKG